MKVMKKSLKYFAMALLASVVFSSCGPEPSPIELMKAPIRVVRNDTITQVEDSDGRLYILNTIERTDYFTAFLDLGEELTLKGK